MTEEIVKTEGKEYWIQVVQEWAASGVGLETWCRANGYSFYQLRYYKRKFARQLATNVPSEAFTEVRDPAPGHQHLTICIGSLRIEVGKDFDPSLLRQVVQVLGGV